MKLIQWIKKALRHRALRKERHQLFQSVCLIRNHATKQRMLDRLEAIERELSD